MTRETPVGFSVPFSVLGLDLRSNNFILRLGGVFVAARRTDNSIRFWSSWCSKSGRQQIAILLQLCGGTIGCSF